MPDTIDLGLDFGSIFFRAAYMLDGEIVPVPISRSEGVWSGAVFAVGPWGQHRFAFESLKSWLGTSGPRVLFGAAGMTITDRVRELLTHFKAHVTDYAGCAIQRVVIAVPGYYPQAQQAAIRRIAEEVGFQQIDLLDDCQAAALGYSTLAALDRSLTLLVFSMGFMGFEVGLIGVNGEGCHTLAHWGGLSPSGRDIDRLLMERCVAEAEGRNLPLPFLKEYDSHAWLDFRDVIEEAKRHLGLGEDTSVILPATVTGTFPLPMVLRVADFEAALKSYVEQALDRVNQVLADGHVTPQQVDKVVLVGGTTRLTAFQTGLEALFGSKLIQPRENLLARGTAVYAAIPTSTGATRSTGRAQPASPPPTPEAILSYAQALADAGEHDTATRYLTQILESVQAVRARIEKGVTKIG